MWKWRNYKTKSAYQLQHVFLQGHNQQPKVSAWMKQADKALRLLQEKKRQKNLVVYLDLVRKHIQKPFPIPMS